MLPPPCPHGLGRNRFRCRVAIFHATLQLSDLIASFSKVLLIPAEFGVMSTLVVQLRLAWVDIISSGEKAEDCSYILFRPPPLTQNYVGHAFCTHYTQLPTGRLLRM